MSPEEVQKLQHGLYIIYWKDGGKSLASVGSRDNGQRWLAPTNWLAYSTDWSEVARVELVATLLASDKIDHAIEWFYKTSMAEEELKKIIWKLRDLIGRVLKELILHNQEYLHVTEQSLLDQLSVVLGNVPTKVRPKDAPAECFRCTELKRTIVDLKDRVEQASRERDDFHRALDRANGAVERITSEQSAAKRLAQRSS